MAAKLDLSIDEGSTWTMTIDFWENTDKTIPVDITNFTFEGAMEFGNSYIPMDIYVAGSSIECSIQYQALEDLASLKGKYDIEGLNTSSDEKYRVIQGAVRANREVTKDQT